MPVTNFPNGISTEGKALKMGSAVITDTTLVIATGLTSIAGAVVSLNEDPGAGAGDVLQVTCTFSGGDLTVALWQDDATAATEDTSVSWIAWGAE